jgi:hypothetical protein
MDKKPNTGTAPWHNAMLLAKFRNEFMHFKPSVTTFTAASWLKTLRRRYRRVAAYKGNFLFPYGFMTYGCAKWAVHTVLTFSAEFAKLLGVKDKFVGPGLNFNLP